MAQPVRVTLRLERLVKYYLYELLYAKQLVLSIER